MRLVLGHTARKQQSWDSFGILTPEPSSKLSYYLASVLLVPAGTIGLVAERFLEIEGQILSQFKKKKDDNNKNFLETEFPCLAVLLEVVRQVIVKGIPRLAGDQTR